MPADVPSGIRIANERPRWVSVCAESNLNEGFTRGKWKLTRHGECLFADSASPRYSKMASHMSRGSSVVRGGVVCGR